jgi:hypothetical protein
MTDFLILVCQIWWLFYNFIKIKEYIQLQAFTDAFRDSNVDCKLILPYLDAVGEMLLPVGAFVGSELKFLLHILACLITQPNSSYNMHIIWIIRLMLVLK